MPKYPLRISTECELEFRKPVEGALKLARLLPHVGRIRIEVPGEPDRLLTQVVNEARRGTGAPVELMGIAPSLQAAPPEAVIWLQRLTVPELDDASLQALLGAVQAEGLLPEVTGMDNPVGALKAAAQGLRGVDNQLEARKWDLAAEKADKLASQHPWMAPLLLERFAAHPLARFGHGQSEAPAAPPADAVPAPRTSRSSAPRRPKGDPPAADLADEALGPHWISNLAPQTHWTLLIDDHSRGPRRAGRLVALLLPPEPGLAPCPGEHTRKADDATHASRLQALAAAPVGVLGFEWSERDDEREARPAAAELLAWVVRLLPLSGPTQLRVLGGARRSERLAEAVAQGLALADDRRRAWITVGEPEAVAKDDPFAAYADSVGFTWHRQGLTAEGPLGTLAAGLVAAPPEPLRALFDDLGGRRGPDGQRWDALIAGPGSPLLDALRDRLTARAAEDDHLWRRYLRHTLIHMDQAETHPELLSAQVSFLAAANGAGKHTLGARVRLAGAVASLQVATAAGAQDPAAAAVVRDLSGQVLGEDPRAACSADLAWADHAALSLDQAGAQARLQPWADRDALVLGARLRARVLGALGRTAGPDGGPQLDAALDALAALSQPEDREREAEAPTLDRARLAVEAEATSDEEALAWVERLTGPLAKRSARLATSRRLSDRAAHHLMLRLLVQRPALGAEHRAAVLEVRDKWVHRSGGHPWPLIELYRALLLDDAGEFEAAKEHAVLGASVAFAEAQGPAQRLVGAVVHAIAARWGVDWPDRDDTLLRLETALPKAQAHVAAIRAFCTAPDSADPRALLRDALPFNFR